MPYSPALIDELTSTTTEVAWLEIGTDADDKTIESVNNATVRLQSEARKSGQPHYLVLICKP